MLNSIASDEAMIANGVNTIRQISATVSSDTTPLRSPTYCFNFFFTGWKITARITAHSTEE